MYIKPLAAIIDSHSIAYYAFADDLQPQVSAPIYKISKLRHSLQSFICDVKAWATANMHKLINNKAELMLVTTKSIKHHHSLPTLINISNVQIPFKQSVNNLGFTLDCHLTMNAHASNIARTCYLELRHMASTCGFLISTATYLTDRTYKISLSNQCLVNQVLWQTSSLFQWLLKHQGSSVQPDARF